MRLYTRSGDSGMTRLFGGTAIEKDDIRLEAYGTVDELNSTIGAVRALLDDPGIDESLGSVQKLLFEIGAYLASPDAPAERVTAADISFLEDWIDAYDAQCPELTQFVLPAGSPDAAAAHVARTVCRRAERRVVTLVRTGVEAPLSLRFLNRLSDLLFAVARLLNVRAGIGDAPWEKRPSGPDEDMT